MNTSASPIFIATRAIVLASASPRRQEFLRGLGLAFTVVAPAAPEPWPGQDETPQAFALRVARAKAAAQLPKRPIRHPCHRGDKQRVFRKEMTDLHEAEKDKSATLYLLKF